MSPTQRRLPTPTPHLVSLCILRTLLLSAGVYLSLGRFSQEHFVIQISVQMSLLHTGFLRPPLGVVPLLVSHIPSTVNIT